MMHQSLILITIIGTIFFVLESVMVSASISETGCKFNTRDGYYVDLNPLRKSGSSMSDLYSVTATPMGAAAPQQFLLNICAGISASPCGQGSMAYKKDTVSGSCTALAGAPAISNLMPKATDPTKADAGVNIHMMGGDTVNGKSQAMHLYIYCDRNADPSSSLQYSMKSSTASMDMYMFKLYSKHGCDVNGSAQSVDNTIVGAVMGVFLGLVFLLFLCFACVSMLCWAKRWRRRTALQRKGTQPQQLLSPISDSSPSSSSQSQQQLVEIAVVPAASAPESSLSSCHAKEEA